MAGLAAFPKGRDITMADRYQDRAFRAEPNYDRGDHQASSKGESDPLAELARLIGQTDPFGSFGRANQPMPPREPEREQYQEREQFHEPERAREADDGAPASPPLWMQRVAAHEQPRQDLDSGLHAQRYPAAHDAADQDYHQAPSFAAAREQHHPHEESDAGRYDDALYGPLPGAHSGELPQDPGYDDRYAYEDEYGEAPDDHGQKSRRGGMITVAVVLALAVVGTGAAFAYRTYVGSPRSGEPPIIRADAGPNKMIPPTQSGDSSGKLIQDRLAGGGTEKLVSREEQPVDFKDSKSGPRVVFPPLNQSANPPTTASVAPGNRPPANTGNGIVGGEEPRRVRTFTVRGDQVDVAAAPAAKPAPGPAVRTAAPPPAPATRNPPPAAANANASSASASGANVSGANGPLSLAPQASAFPTDMRTHIASTGSAPQSIATPAASSGGYLVQVSSQRNEADAQASFRALQGKFPAVLGSRAPLIKRADLGEKGVYYRAMVGPFGSPDEASQFCGSLKSAGGQCVVQRN